MEGDGLNNMCVIEYNTYVSIRWDKIKYIKYTYDGYNHY